MKKSDSSGVVYVTMPTSKLSLKRKRRKRKEVAAAAKKAKEETEASTAAIGFAQISPPSGAASLEKSTSSDKTTSSGQSMSSDMKTSSDMLMPNNNNIKESDLSSHTKKQITFDDSADLELEFQIEIQNGFETGC